MHYNKVNHSQSKSEINAHLDTHVELHTWLTIDYKESRAFLCSKGLEQPDETSIHINLPYDVIRGALSYFYKRYQDPNIPLDISDPTTWRSIYDISLGIYQIEITIRGVLEKCQVKPYLYQLSDVRFLKTPVAYGPSRVDIFPTDTYNLEVYLVQKVIPNAPDSQNQVYSVTQRRTFQFASEDKIPKNLPVIENINAVKLGDVVHIAGNLRDISPAKKTNPREEHIILDVKADTQYRDTTIWLQSERYFRAFKIDQGVLFLRRVNAEIIGRITLLEEDYPNPVAISRKPMWKLHDIQQITIIEEFEVEQKDEQSS